MLIYVANARRVVAINGNMTAPGRATIAHYRSTRPELMPPEGLLAAGVPAAFDALAMALRGVRHHARLARSSRRLSRYARTACRCIPGLSGHGETPKDLVRADRHRVDSRQSRRNSARNGQLSAASICLTAKCRIPATSSTTRPWPTSFAACSRPKPARASRAAKPPSTPRATVSIAAISRGKSSNGPRLTAVCSRTEDLARFTTRYRGAGQRRLSRRHRAQMPDLVARSGLSSATAAAGRF